MRLLWSNLCSSIAIIWLNLYASWEDVCHWRQQAINNTQILISMDAATTLSGTNATIWSLCRSICHIHEHFCFFHCSNLHEYRKTKNRHQQRDHCPITKAHQRCDQSHPTIDYIIHTHFNGTLYKSFATENCVSLLIHMNGTAKKVIKKWISRRTAISPPPPTTTTISVATGELGDVLIGRDIKWNTSLDQSIWIYSVCLLNTSLSANLK